MKYHRFAACVATLAIQGAQAQFFSVEQIDKSFTVRSQPTVTVVREAADAASARAVVLLVPGGVGHVGMRADMTFNRMAEPRSTWSRIGRALSEPGETAGTLHFATLDSPWALPSTANDVSSRGTRDHMVRIESVVEFYRARYKLPIWLVGHSNGGYSVAEFHKYLRGKDRENLLAGIIFSAGRSLSSFGSEGNLPALFMAPEEDGCASTPPAGVRAIHDKFKAVNKAPTELLFLKGGEPEGDPCFSGIHMYHRAEAQAAKAIDDFIRRHTQAK